MPTGYLASALGLLGYGQPNSFNWEEAGTAETFRLVSATICR